MLDVNKLLAELRAAAKERYEACTKVIDVMEENFNALDTMAAVLNGQGLAVGTSQGTFSLPNKTNRQLVIEALTRQPGLTMKDLEEKTKLTRTQLKSAIYAQDSRELFVTKKGNGKARYYLRENDMK